MPECTDNEGQLHDGTHHRCLIFKCSITIIMSHNNNGVTQNHLSVYLLTAKLHSNAECLKTAHHHTSTAHHRTSPFYGHNCTSQHLYKPTNSHTVCVLNSSVQCWPIVPACHTTHHA